MMNLLIYTTFLFVSLLIFKIQELSKENYTKNIFFIVGLLFIFLFGTVRYDVGNDYANYVYMIERISNIADYNTSNYGLFTITSKIFSFSKNNFIWTMSVYYVFTITVFLYLFKKKEIIFWGFFTFVTFGLLFDSFDRIRQMAALSIFIWSIDDIHKRHISHFIFKLLVGALFHYSILILLPFYFLAKIRIKHSIITIVFFIMLAGYFLGIWTSLYEFIYSLIPYYGDLYAETKYVAQSRDLSSGLGFLGTVVFVYLNIILSPANNTYKNLLIFGLLIYIFGMGNLNITRISDYFLASVIITFPLLISYYRNIYNRLFIVFPMILFLLALFFKTVISSEYFEYQTVFSDNFSNSYLKIRDYKR